METFYTYILYSPSSDRYYIGQTHNIRQRLVFHTAGSTPETAGIEDWLVVFLESFSSRQAAMGLESRIKRAKSRLSIRRYISDPRNMISQPISIAQPGSVPTS